MKVEKQTLENHHAKIIVEVEPEQVEKAKQRAARQIANRVKIPGFRPGKAPYHIIERTLGLEAILQQAYETLGEEIYPKALDEIGVKPYAPAQFKPPSEDLPLTFEFTFPMDASVNLGDYRMIREPYELPLTNNEDVEKILTDLRERNAVLETVDRPAQVGDEITIKLSGNRLYPEEGEDPILVNERSQTVLIKSEADSNEWPFQGFSVQLVDLSAGEEKTLTYTFPDDSSFTSLRGKEVEYRILVDQVKSRTLPELDDEFAKSIGDFETLQKLQDTILEGLKSQAKSNYDTEYSEKVLVKVIEGASIEYPSEMVEDQITASIERLKNQLTEQGQDFNTYLKMRSMDIVKLREQMKPQAESTIKRSVVMYELAQAESITVERDEMENEAMSTLNDLMRYVTPDRFKRMSKDRNFINQISRNASVDVLSRKTLERLATIAKGESSVSAPSEIEIATGGELTSESTMIDTSPNTEIQPTTEILNGKELSVEETPSLLESSVNNNTQQEG